MKIKYTIFTILFLTLLLSCGVNSDETKIREVFKTWQQTQIDNNEFASQKNCNYEYVISKEDYGPVFGFPDIIDFKYTDLNGDKKTDALATFTPKQCDGGNMSSMMQHQILILSNKSSYEVDNKYFKNINLGLQTGFYTLDSLSNKSFFGTYYTFQESDGFCCPSIQRPIVIDFNTKQVEINKTNKKLTIESNTENIHSVAINFINSYIDFCNNRNNETKLIEWVKDQSTVSNKFKSELEKTILRAEKENPQYGLGFDPILDSQDYPDNGFELKTFNSEYVIVKGIHWTDFQLTLKIKKIKEEWLVDGSGVINIPFEKRMKR